MAVVIQNSCRLTNFGLPFQFRTWMRSFWPTHLYLLRASWSRTPRADSFTECSSGLDIFSLLACVAPALCRSPASAIVVTSVVLSDCSLHVSDSNRIWVATRHLADAPKLWGLLQSAQFSPTSNFQSQESDLHNSIRKPTLDLTSKRMSLLLWITLRAQP